MKPIHISKLVNTLVLVNMFLWYGTPWYEVNHTWIDHSQSYVYHNVLRELWNCVATTEAHLSRVQLIQQLNAHLNWKCTNTVRVDNLFGVCTTAWNALSSMSLIQIGRVIKLSYTLGILIYNRCSWVDFATVGLYAIIFGTCGELAERGTLLSVVENLLARTTCKYIFG